MAKLIAVMVTAIFAGLLVGYFLFLTFAFTGSWKMLAGVGGVLVVWVLVDLFVIRRLTK